MKPYLVLKAPDELTIFYHGENDPQVSNLSGQVSCINTQSSTTTSIDARIHLLRIGRLKGTHHTDGDQTSKRVLKCFRHSLGSDWKDFESAENILSCPIRLVHDAKSKKASYEFQLKIPAHLPPTTVFPSIEISYALVVSATLQCGQMLRTGQLLRISRRPIEPIPLQTTPMAYSYSPLALRVSFEAPKSRACGVATTLHLRGLSGISPHSSQTSLAGNEEMIKVVPQMVQWEVEEKAIVVQVHPDEADSSPAPGIESVRIVRRGIHRSVASSPPQKSGDRQLDFDAEIPFQIDMPEDVDFPSPLVATECLLDTWSSENSRYESARFALQLEHNLRIRLQMCEDLMSSGEGHGKPVWYIYTVVLPLRGLSKHDDGVLTACQKKYCITREAL
jgi:hypothetical protein